jgi:undecaprenyl-diphosphatase
MLASEWVEAVVLGVVQGIGEFLPISSSGHVVVVQQLFQGGKPTSNAETAHDKAMNVILHFGTLLSILFVYRKDLLTLLLKPRLVAFIVLATIPAAVVGLGFGDQLEPMFSEPLVVAVGWLVTAGFLLGSRRIGSEKRTVDEMRWFDALLVGVFQAIAIIPGISRSGSTISGGLLSGMRRDAAARFSFFIAIPAIGGAALVEGKDLILEALKVLSGRASNGQTLDSLRLGPMLLGMVISAVVGYFALTLLLRMLYGGRLHYFAIYCIVVSILTMLWRFGAFGSLT